MRTEQAALTDYLTGFVGPDKAYKSLRQLSLRAGLSENALAYLVERGRGEPETRVKLAEELGIKPSRLFILAGWLDPEELTGEQLSSEDEQVLKVVRALPQERRRVLLEVAEAMREPASRQRAQPRAAEASARYQAAPGPR